MSHIAILDVGMSKIAKMKAYKYYIVFCMMDWKKIKR